MQHIDRIIEESDCAGKSGRRIYVVEDEREINDIIVRYLRNENYEVTPFYRGDTALEALISNQPDLLVLDIMLPGLDGIQILEELRKSCKLPVIIISAKKDESYRIRGFELGGDDYLTKPFSMRELVARVKSVFRRAEYERSLHVAQQEQLVRQLYHADRMSELGQLMAGIAHDVNNPLTGILGYSEMLLYQVSDNSLREQLEIIHQEALRASRIMRNILSFSRAYQPEREALDICRCLDDCLAIVSDELRIRNIEVRREFQSVPETAGDHNKLMQVFINLLINAEHAVQEKEYGGIIEVQVTGGEDYLEVMIGDNGPGVPPEKATKIFEPFFTTKQKGKGTGLGLSIACKIITEHQGQIRVEKSPLGGAAFIVQLPVIAASPCNAGHGAAAGSFVKARILAVDDESSLRKVIEVSLERDGHEIITASGTDEALRLMQERTYDLLILDMLMPGEGGIDFYRRLPEPRPELLIITGDTVSSGIQDFSSETEAYFLSKPFTMAEIADKVQAIVRKNAGLSSCCAAAGDTK
jgi:two-component system NtrC family sensor kinase